MGVVDSVVPAELAVGEVASGELVAGELPAGGIAAGGIAAGGVVTGGALLEADGGRFVAEPVSLAVKDGSAAVSLGTAVGVSFGLSLSHATPRASSSVSDADHVLSRRLESRKSAIIVNQASTDAGAETGPKVSSVD